jgi:hypothetical protein
LFGVTRNDASPAVARAGSGADKLALHVGRVEIQCGGSVRRVVATAAGAGRENLGLERREIGCAHVVRDRLSGTTDVPTASAECTDSDEYDKTQKRADRASRCFASVHHPTPDQSKGKTSLHLWCN